MQFKYIAAVLTSLAATAVVANPVPNVEAAEGAEIMARAEQAEQAKQAKQGKQFFGGPGGFGNPNLFGPQQWGPQQNNPGLVAFGIGGGGVALNGNPLGNQQQCPGWIPCWQCNGWGNVCGPPWQNCQCY